MALKMPAFVPVLGSDTPAPRPTTRTPSPALARLVAVVGMVALGLVFMASSASEAGALDDSLFGENDMVVAPESPGADGPMFQSTAAFATDPSGLVENFSFSSLYTSLAVDRISVWTCPAWGPVERTASQAAAMGNGAVADHYDHLSSGQYSLVFEAGGDVPAAGSLDDCMDYAAARTSSGSVNGIVFIGHISGGYAGPGSTCALSGCGTSWPANARYGVVTDGSLISVVWAHEHGHMLGWPHSNSGGASEYDNPIDLMSGNTTVSGYTYSSPYETVHANILSAGWFSATDVWKPTGVGASFGLSSLGSSGINMVAIPDPSGGYWSVGARISDPDDPIPSSWEGVEVVHVGACGSSCYPLNRAQTTVDVDPATSTPPRQVLSVGEFAIVGGWKISVEAKVGLRFDVSVLDPDVVVIPDGVVRLSGADRYATAAAVSSEAFASASTVFVATGANFPDALAAAAAGGHLGAPVLLVGDTVPSATAGELARLSPDTIYVVGGTGVVSNSVAAQLK